MKKFIFFSIFIALILLFPQQLSYGQFSNVLDDEDMFGYSITEIGDLNNDGFMDIVAGAPYDDDGGANAGALYILFLNSDGTVKTHQKISALEGNFANALQAGVCFANAIVNLGDLDGDGVTDLAVGAHNNYAPGQKHDRTGAVYILFLNSDGMVKTSHEISNWSGNFALDDNDSFGM